MQGLDFGLKDSNQSGLDFGMDETYTNFLSKKRRKMLGSRKIKAKVLRHRLNKAEKSGDDKKVIKLSEKLERMSYLPKTPNKRFFGKKGKEVVKRIVAKKMSEKTCKDRLRTMRLSPDGMVQYIADCEKNGDFSASKVKKKERVAEALLVNDIVKQERVADRIDDEIKGQEDRMLEKKKPETEKVSFQKKILPILAIGGIVFLIIKKF